MNALVVRDRDSDSNGSLDQRTYVTHDANFNITGLVGTGSPGSVLQRFVYDPYGKRMVLAANWSGTSDAYVFLRGFQGGWMDAVTGRINFQARDLDVDLMRWLTPDPHPSGPYVDGMNPLQFVGGRPTALTDPTGLVPNNQESATPDQLRNALRRYRESSEKLGKDCKEMVNGLSTFMRSNNYNLYGVRYVYTNDGHWVDLLHFFELAGYSQMHGNTRLPKLLGWVNEVLQWVAGDESGSPGGSNEDLFSNAAGAKFGANCDCSKKLEDLVLDFMNVHLGGLKTPPLLGQPLPPPPPPPPPGNPPNYGPSQPIMKY